VSEPARSVGGHILPGQRDGHGSFRIIVIAASAGGIAPLRTILASLPARLAAAVFVVVHSRPAYPSVLPYLVGMHSALPAFHAVDGDPIIPGQILFAPPDGCHMVLDGGVVRLIASPREHHTRPAADPLFRSAAQYGRRTIAVVLSGLGRDAADGAAAIKAAGGTVIVQSPEAAAYRPMPENAWAAASMVDSPELDIAQSLVRLSGKRRRVASAAGADNPIQRRNRWDRTSGQS
jgi:two-component system chemotaxis response regulator CheB